MIVTYLDQNSWISKYIKTKIIEYLQIGLELDLVEKVN